MEAFSVHGMSKVIPLPKQVQKRRCEAVDESKTCSRSPCVCKRTLGILPLVQGPCCAACGAYVPVAVIQLQWPEVSADLSPIENIWALMERRIYTPEQDTYTSVEQMWTRVQQEWRKLTEEEIRPYFPSLPSRMAAVVQAKGWHTKY